jgi:phage baseplate assembly protein gpV
MRIFLWLGHPTLAPTRALTRALALALTLALAGCGGGGGEGAADGSSGGSFVSVAAMRTARFHAASALLPNGKVLVAGGFLSSTTSLASVELYDPATGQWADAAPMSANRAGTGFLVPLQDGRVLALSGSSAEIYDWRSARWTAAATPPGGAAFQPFLLLADGRVLATSGNAGTVLLYDPAQDRWTSQGGFDRRRDFAMVQLANGSVLMSGGWIDSAINRTTTSRFFDPATGAWRNGPTMHVARSHHFGFALPDGRVVVSHGTTSSGSPAGTTEVYDAAANNWSLAGNVIKFDGTTIGAAMTPLGSGRVLVTGGAGAGGGVILDQVPQGLLNETNAEVFDPATLTWQRATVPGTGLVQARYYHAAVRLNDGQVLLAGGRNGGGALPSAERFRP